MSRSQWIQFNTILALVLMLIAGARNIFFEHYPINNAPVSSDLVSVLVILTSFLYGFKLWNPMRWGIDYYLHECIYLLLFYILVSAGCFVIQFTPFDVIDERLIQWDAYLSFDLARVVNQFFLHEHWVKMMSWMYDSLWFELAIIPLTLIAMRRQDLLRELYSFVLISCIIGFTLYYVFPTTAPASAFGGEGFMPQQHATGIKFYEMHHYITPSTDDGGLISFPSFHVIFAWSMVYVMRGWKKLCWLLSFWNLGITISCVVLGWHYLSDIVGSAGVMMMSFGLERLCVYETSNTFRR